jgi:CRP-like cAMP-binding protein
MTRQIIATQQACLEPLFGCLAANAGVAVKAAPNLWQLDVICKHYSAGLRLREPAIDTGRLLIVVSGWACEQRISAEGRRQIFNFIAPGDFIDFQAADDNGERVLMALTPLKLLDMRHVVDGERAASDPAWARLAAYAQRSHKRRLYDHLTRLGHKSAYERVAHLLLDFHARLDAVGMVDGRRFALPLTQEMLADALGITLVHVNRVLQQLRQQGLIELASGFVGLLRPKALAEIAEFDLECEDHVVRPYPRPENSHQLSI